MGTKRLLLLSSSVIAACIAGAASAEDQPVKTAAASPPPAAASPVGEVLITAEKREQNLQQVPIAVSAFTDRQRDLQGIQSIQDISNFTPGLTYSSQLDRTSMRGVGRLSNILSADSSVAVYSDDFFTTSTTEAGRDTLFVDRVEVLRGPQGTLYGRNAIGGAINIISRRPTLDPYAEARAFFGNFGFMQYEGAVSGTVDEKLGLRLAAYDTQQSDGYFTNLYPGARSEGGVKHEWYVEGQFEFKPTDQIDWWVKGFTQGWHNNAAAPGALLFTPTTGPYDTALVSPYDELTYNPGFAYSTGPFGPVPGSVTGGCAGVTQNPAIADIHTFCHNTQGFINLDKVYVVNSHFTYHFPGVDLKYVFGYDNYHYTSIQDVDTLGIDSYKIPITGTGVCSAFFASLGICGPLTVYPTLKYNYEEQNRWLSHEVTLSSTGAGPVQWILGGYYFDEHYVNPILINGDPRQTQLIGQQGGLIYPNKTPAPPQADFAYYTSNYDMHTKSEAVYAQATFKATDELKFTGGIRYTYDKKNGVEFYRILLMNGTTLGIDPTSLGTFMPAVDVTPFLAAGAIPVAVGGTPQSARGVSSPTTPLANGQFTRGLSDHSSAVTGTARVEWTPDPMTLAYGSYSRGYKAFAFNAGTIALGNEAAAESIDAFEIGLKKTLMNRLTIDAAAFWDNYHDAQIPIGVTTSGVISNEFVSIPEARTAGIELAATWPVTDALQLTFSYSFNKTEILSSCLLANNVATGSCFEDVSDPLAVLPGAKPIGPRLPAHPGIPAAYCLAVPDPNLCAQLQDIKGGPLPQAPENKIALNGVYTWSFEPGDLSLSGTFIWKDRSFGSIFERAPESAPAWEQVDARLTWAGKRDKYEIILYVKNLFDTRGYNSAGYGVPLSYGTAAYYDLTPPRLFGVELHYKLF
jgi:iron complex outermembrane receptor protein